MDARLFVFSATPCEAPVEPVRRDDESKRDEERVPTIFVAEMGRLRHYDLARATKLKEYDILKPGLAEFVCEHSDTNVIVDAKDLTGYHWESTWRAAGINVVRVWLYWVVGGVELIPR